MAHKKSPEESLADKLDSDLYHIIYRAESQTSNRKHWLSVADALRGVRPLIRERMHPKDRETTI